MFEHRFRSLLAVAPASPALEPAFVPCPLPVMLSFGAAHQAQVQEIFRLALERTREQLRRRAARVPRFSLN
jgi:hypothetical protein